jgi:hypothetical protein
MKESIKNSGEKSAMNYKNTLLDLVNLKCWEEEQMKIALTNNYRTKLNCHSALKKN